MSEKLMHKYLDGLMDKTESLQFETQLKNDPKLAQELSLLKDMRKHVNQHAQTEIAMRVITDVGNEFNPSTSTKIIPIRRKSNWKYFLPLAAAAVLVFGIFMRPLFNSSSAGPINYEASPLSFQERGQESNELLYLSAEAFNKGDYPLAVSHLNSLIEADLEVNKARLYKSIALLKLDNHTEARRELQKLESVIMFENASYYYQGLSYLDTNNSTEANRYFNLVKENSSYYTRAQERLGQISSANK